MLEVRSAARSLPGYEPLSGERAGLLCDLNENLVGCSPRVLERLRTMNAGEIARYPDRLQGECQVAQFLGVRSEQVLLTNGADEAVHLLCEAYLQPGDEVLIVVPTFGMYSVYAAAAEARIIALQAREDFSLPIERLLDAIGERTRLIALPSPNNPTGAVIPPEEILAIAYAAPHAAILADEAYFDFHGITALGSIASFDNLFVVRTFSKAHGLAGLRVGALIGAARQMAGIRRFASPYNVNAVALACLPAALEPGYVETYVRQVREGRTRLAQAMQELGVQVWPSAGNFLLVRVGERVHEFVAAMAQQGVRVRSRDADPGCAGCVRITVGPPELMDHVIAVARVALRVCSGAGA